MKPSLKHSFGFRPVSEQERESRIRDVFEKVAKRYDLMNDAMSFGIHRLWKRKMVRMADAGPNELVLDVAAGTGDVAKRIAKSGCTVYLVDPSSAMMMAGRSGHGLQCIASSAEQLALQDHSADRITIAFGIRNTTDMESALTEIYRVLKPGGKCIVLEFSTPVWWLKPFYDLYSFYVIPRLGAWIAREKAAYQYLIESIRKFPDQNEFRDIMRFIGFADVSYTNLSFGIACIHIGNKPGDAHARSQRQQVSNSEQKEKPPG